MSAADAARIDECSGPILDGALERAHRSHLEKFYDVVPFALDVPTLNRQIRQWEHIYNIQRPHQALAYRTPADVIHNRPLAPWVSRIIWTSTAGRFRWRTWV